MKNEASCAKCGLLLSERQPINASPAGIVTYLPVYCPECKKYNSEHPLEVPSTRSRKINIEIVDLRKKK